MRPRTFRTMMAAAAAGLGLMLVADTAMAADAAALWDKNCASCHGKDGKGQTKMGEKLKVRDLTDPAVKAKVTKASASDSMTKGVEQEGKVVMKPFKDKLSADEIQALADYSVAFK